VDIAYYCERAVAEVLGGKTMVRAVEEVALKVLYYLAVTSRVSA